VLYLQDGQNVFDGATAFIAGQEWEVDEAAERLIRRGLIEPLIVVALENAGAQRTNEYTATPDASVGAGGGLARYERALTEELKPWVDGRFRSRPEREATAIGGSSLGALAALEIALRRPQVFGRVAALSVAAWWDGQAIVRSVEALAARPDTRVWVDVGTREPRHAVADARRLRDALLRKGWREGADLRYVEVPGGTHDEKAWARRVPEVLKFLFPPQPKPPGAAASQASTGAAAASTAP
jgi:predicted alpha/beta superfamily hydrolase